MVIEKGDPKNKGFKKRLRLEMTEPERHLWARLRSKQLLGIKFRRQHGIGPYIVDFFCPEKKLAIEIDGETHTEEEHKKRDAMRDRYLEGIGAEVIRVTNEDVMKRMDGVMEMLMQKLEG